MEEDFKFNESNTEESTNTTEVNKKLTSYKAIKDMEIKEGEFEKTSTMKIKRFKEISKKPNNKEENTDKKNA